MTLLEQLQAARTTIKGSCPFAIVRATLQPADSTQLDTALADAATPSLAIAMALTAAGQRIAEIDVRNHRAGDCPCVIKTGATP